MTLGQNTIARSLATWGRARALVLGALAALACSACASDRGETVATAPAAGGPVTVTAAPASTKVASSPPIGYPWATNGPSLPTASARAPVIR